MENILEYKGYHTKAEVDLNDKVIYGKIEGIKDLVNFESETLEGFEEEFHLAVDDYLQLCEQVGKNPEKEYKGTFNIRISPELHKKVALLAFKSGESLNQTVEKAIQSYVSGISQSEVTIQETVNTASHVAENQKSYSKTGANTTPAFTVLEGKNHWKMSYEG